MPNAPATIPKKQMLIGATIGLILKHGYAGTTVDLICAEAGVTKGSFFHYFDSKEAIMYAAMDAWSAGWKGIVTDANFEGISDPVERVFKLLDVMSAAYMDPRCDIGCVVGNIAQELSLSNGAMRKECERHFEMWLEVTVKLLTDAKLAQNASFDPDGVGRFMIAMVQGSMLVAKTMDDRIILAANVEHLRTYLNPLMKQY